MVFFKKKESTIDRRLRELQREMSRLNTNIKDCTRTPRNPDESTTHRAPAPATPSKTQPAPSPVPQAPIAPELPEPAAEVASAPAVTHLEPALDDVTDAASAAPAADLAQKARNDLFAHVSKGPAEDVRQPDLFTSSRVGTLSESNRHPGEGQTDRERFASYFMAGHFQNLRPLRHERRMMRNRAILMLVLVVILGVIIWRLFS